MPSNYHAVLIGNREFPSDDRLAPLRCPINDVRDMADLLKSEQHGPYKVHVLEDQEHHVVHRAIYTALKNATRDDRVLIFYAGHGKLSEDDGSLYLASHNTQIDYLPATSVAAADVMKFMNNSACKQLILILDCCYSGAVDKILSGAVFRGEVADQVASNLQGTGGSGSYILTASTGIQRAEEREADNNGLLTKHLIAGIRDGLADRDDDGFISMTELTEYVQDKVSSEGRQKPLAYVLRQEDRSITIAKTGKAARSRKLAETLVAIYLEASADRASLRTVRSALGLLVPEPSASVEDKAVCAQFLERLHSARKDSYRFTEALEEAPALSSRLSTSPLKLQRRLEGELNRAQQQLRTALDKQEEFRVRTTHKTELVSGAYAKLGESKAAVETLTAELTALKATVNEERLSLQSAETKLHGDLAAQKKLISVERLRTRDLEAELTSLRKLIADSNAAIEKLNAQLKREQAEKADLAKEKSDPKELSSLKSEIKALGEKLAAEKTARETAEAKVIYKKIAGDVAQIKLDPNSPLNRWADFTLPAIKQTINLDAASEQPKISSLPKNLWFDPMLPPLNPPRKQSLLNLFQAYASEPNFFISPNIPADTLTKASAGINLENREVLAVIAPDPLFLIGSTYILFDTDSLHWTFLYSQRSIRYADINPGTVRKNQNLVLVNEHTIPSGWANQMKGDTLVFLIKALAVLKP